MVDISKIKPGDKVILKPMKVVRVDKNIKMPCGVFRGFVLASGYAKEINVIEQAISEHIPAPREFKVGDRVVNTYYRHEPEGVILAIDGDEAWIRIEYRSFRNTWNLHDLKHID